MIDVGEHPEAAIILFTGFRQRYGPGSGLWRLYAKLAQRYHDRRRFLLALRTWDSSPEATAELVRWAKPKRLYVVAYSYGAGWALDQFAARLPANSPTITASDAIPIDAAFCIDPVPRWRFLPLKLISLTRWGTYEVPPNVRTCYGYRQVMGSPYGRPCEGVGNTQVKSRMVFGSEGALAEHAPGDRPRWQIVPSMDHSRIDDFEAVHEDVMHLLSVHIERREHATP